MQSAAKEDQFTKATESQTARIPSVGYLTAAIVSMGISAIFKIAGKDHAALFVRAMGASFPNHGPLQQNG